MKSEIYLLTYENKESGGDITTQLFSVQADAVLELQSIAKTVIEENDWLNDVSDLTWFETQKDEYEFNGDYILEDDSFYLADIAQITIEKQLVR